MGEEEITRFLSHLATVARVSASTQNQARSAVLFWQGRWREQGRPDTALLVHAPRVMSRARIIEAVWKLVSSAWPGPRQTGLQVTHTLYRRGASELGELHEYRSQCSRLPAEAAA
jgi:hypothetical protein